MIRMLAKVLPGTILLSSHQVHFSLSVMQNITSRNYPRSGLLETVYFLHGHVIYKNSDTLYQYIHDSTTINGVDQHILILSRQKRVLQGNFDWARMKRKSRGY